MNHEIRPPEIDNHTTKIIVGVIALSLAFFTSYLSPNQLDSISASYWSEGDWPRNLFVGFLFAISAFLFSYNGHSTPQMLLSRAAALAALGVAMFPCECSGHTQIIPGVHYISAAIMFGVLAAFCYFFFKRARAKTGALAGIRSLIYALCGFAIVAAITLMAANVLAHDALSRHIHRFTFYAEATGLVAFGIAWLTASRMLPVIDAVKVVSSYAGDKRNKRAER